MRELKFRVWEEREKEYDTWSYYLDSSGVLFRNVYGNFISTDNQYILELSTGLKDKNGKEIYEGDIVDYNDDGECIGVVEYDAPEFCLNADATNWARMFLKGAPHQRVIGNIHENNELLEGGK